MYLYLYYIYAFKDRFTYTEFIVLNIKNCCKYNYIYIKLYSQINCKNIDKDEIYLYS